MQKMGILKNNILVFIFSLPFAVSMYMNGAYGYRFVLVFAMLIILSILFLWVYRDKSNVIGFNKLHIVFVFYLISYLLSWYFGQVRSFGFEEIILWAGSYLFSIFFVYFVSDNSRDQILKIFVYIVALSCLVGYVYFFYVDHPRFAGNFVSLLDLRSYAPNMFASLLVVVIPLSLYYFYKYPNWLYSCINILFICSLILTQSRTSLLGLMFILFIVFIGFFRDRRFLLRLFVILVLSIALFASIQGIKTYVGVNDGTRTLQRLTLNDLNKKETTVSQRLLFWQTSLDMFINKPVFGYGPRSFYYYMTRNQTDTIQRIYHPHNIVLKILAENGLVTFSFFLLLMIVLARNFVQDYFYNLRQRDLEFFIFLSVFGLIFAQITDYTLHSSAHVILLVIFITMLLKQTKDKQDWKISFKNMMAFSIVVITLISITGFSLKKSQGFLGSKIDAYARLNPLDNEIYLQRAKESFENHDYESVDTFLQTYFQYDKYNNPLAYELYLQNIIDLGYFDVEKIQKVIDYLHIYNLDIVSNDTYAVLDDRTQILDRIFINLINYLPNGDMKIGVQKEYDIYQKATTDEKNRLKTRFRPGLTKNNKYIN